MHIILNNSSMIPIYEQLMAQIKAAVIGGELQAGAALPSVRSLAAELRISALTVKKAYDKLEEEGFVVTVHGKGSYISETDTQLATEARKREAEKQMDEAVARALASGLSKEEIRELVEMILEN
ncbi:MAG: GntR family transcriptional regulator [Clostridia bacterium]|nr:GntR family transcriptional regulator [Clostridia bacterium]